MISASIAGPFDPSASAPIWWNCRYLPGLRPVVPEHGADVVEPRDAPRPVQTVLQVRAHHGRRVLGPKREAPPLSVGEGVHLLRHDVGRLSHRAHEELGRLEDRRSYLAVAAAPEISGERELDARASPPCARRRNRSFPSVS